MPTALVINPYVADFKLYDEWMHPLGLYFLISLLEKNGIEVRYFNCLQRSDQAKSKKFNTGHFPYTYLEKPHLYQSIPRKYKLYGRPENELSNFLQQDTMPNIICIGTMMTYWLPGVVETIKIIRAVHPEVPIAIGGIAARLMPEAVKELLPESTIIGTIDTTEPFVLHKSIRPLAQEEQSSLLAGFRHLEKPAHGPILMSLGCPMACTYCASSFLQGKFRLRPHEVVIKEIVTLAENYAIQNFSFFDDALLFKAEEGLVPLLTELSTIFKPGRLKFHAPNGLHLHYITEELALTLKSAGFESLRFGYENGSADYGGDTSRKADRQALTKKIAILKNAGFVKNEIGVYVMAGLPGQTPSQVHEELDFVASCGVKAKPVFLSPVPGTMLFEHYAAAFPQLRTDPLWHNDVFFITQLPGWNWEEMEKIRLRVRELNR